MKPMNELIARQHRRRRPRLALALLLLAASACAGPGQKLTVPSSQSETAHSLEAGAEAYNKGFFETALREFRPLAEQGNATAQASLGAMYALGQGVPQDAAEAVRWYRKAAVQGLAEAQFLLGA